MLDEVRAAIAQRTINGDGVPTARRSWTATAPVPIRRRSSGVPATAGLIERAVTDEHR
jgi:hypothetical protein